LSNRIEYLYSNLVKESINKDLKIVSVPPPSNKKKKALPYQFNGLEESYKSLIHNEILSPSSIQNKLSVDDMHEELPQIEELSVFRDGGKCTIPPLTNGNISTNYLIQFNEVNCILEKDCFQYKKGDVYERIALEIPIPFYRVQDYARLEVDNKPFIIPNNAYDDMLGLLAQQL